MTDTTKTDTTKTDKARDALKDSANAADLTSSPALNDDAQTDGDGAGDQSLPEGNRFEN